MTKTRISILLLACIFALSSAAFAADAVNLALGKSYTIVTHTPNSDLEAIATKDYPDTNNAKLTDGKVAEKPDFQDPMFVGYLRQAGRDVIIDLGKKAAISEVSVRFLADPDVGINFPASAAVSFSEDGKVWSAPVSKTIQESLVAEVLALSFKGANTARFVKVFFPVNVWVFTDEISVFGTWAQ